MRAPVETDFDDWLVTTFAEVGAFTMLFVLVGIDEPKIHLLRSAYVHVVGDETRWAEMKSLFSGARVAWSGAVFFRAGREGLVDDAEASARLTSLVRHLHEDRSVIGDGELFNQDGLRLRLEELKPN